MKLLSGTVWEKTKPQAPSVLSFFGGQEEIDLFLKKEITNLKHSQTRRSLGRHEGEERRSCFAFRVGRTERNRSLKSHALGHRKNRSRKCSSDSVHKMVQKLRSQPFLRGAICSLSKTPRRLINEAFTVAKIPSDILSIQIECAIRNGWSS